MNNVYTISADMPFADTLAHWIIRQYGQSPEALPRVWVLLPSHRSLQSLRNAFLRVTDGHPLLLPRMQALGEVEENEFSLIGGVDVLPPPPDFAARRLFILTQLIQTFRTQATGKTERIDHALRLAQELARLLDEVEREQVSLSDIATLVPDEFAQHWQVTVEFLQILSQHWPHITEQEGLISPVAYRNKALQSLAGRWRHEAPSHPVIAAGSTGSIPATADLLSVIATLPQGAVVLPGYDTRMDENYCRHLAPSHPQWGMQHLLRTLKCMHDDVQRINDVPESARTQLAREIMRPAETVQAWQTLSLDIDAAIAGVTLVECAQSEEEAEVVTLLLREALETRGKTAALITHDRSLARRVAAHVQRYGITVNDSAGALLAQTPAAVFLRLILHVMESGAGAVSLLSLLKHPFAYAGERRAECLEAARLLEIAALRRPQSYRNIEGLQAILQYENSPDLEPAKILLAHLQQDLAPLEALHATDGTLHFRDILAAHLTCAQALAGQILWQGHEAAALVDLITQWQTASAQLQVKPSVYGALWDALIAGNVVRVPYGTHPRLAILSPMEARMQRFDRVILGGLNEGSWPPESAIDPWFNRTMRETTGLPVPEVAIGRAAHDWSMAFHAPEVFLTRAQKVEGSPSTPSRWLEKLHVLLQKYGKADAIDAPHLLGWVHALRNVEQVTPCTPPAPKPPLEARPKRLSVTEIETWMRDPYSIYAKYILRLTPLPPLEQELTNADFGSAVHKALERWLRVMPQALAPDALEKLLQFGREALQPLLFGPQVETLWWPRFTRIAGWVFAQEQERRTVSKASLAEVEGTYNIGAFTLTGRADRIDQLYEGSLIISDYKTAAPPAERDVKQGIASQLLLLALITSDGKCEVQGDAVALEYWHLIGSRVAGKIMHPVVSSEINAHIEQAKNGLHRLVVQYNNPDFPYWFTPVASRGRRVNDYAHLARVQEWS